MLRPKLHLDADTSMRVLQRELARRGHDVSRTPNEWMLLDASDQEQLLGATAQGRLLFTFNVRDFVAVARHYPGHGGLALAAQASWSLAELIAALDVMLSTTEAADWIGRTRWLNEWRENGWRG